MTASSSLGAAMVMVTGIICAAVAAITTVGTEAADIIMDGTGADIADIHSMRQGRLEDEAALSAMACSPMSRLVSSLTVRCTEFGRCRACRCGQAAKCYVTAFGTFEDFPGDTPTNPVFLSPN